MITYDEHGNIISDGFTKPRQNKSNTDQSRHNSAGESSGQVIQNGISPELEQARQLTAKVLTDKGYPVVGSAFAAVAYGLEIFMSNTNDIQDTFNNKGGKV